MLALFGKVHDGVVMTLLCVYCWWFVIMLATNYYYIMKISLV